MSQRLNETVRTCTYLRDGVPCALPVAHGEDLCPRCKTVEALHRHREQATRVGPHGVMR